MNFGDFEIITLRHFSVFFLLIYVFFLSIFRVGTFMMQPTFLSRTLIQSTIEDFPWNFPNSSQFLFEILLEWQTCIYIKEDFLEGTYTSFKRPYI